MPPETGLRYRPGFIHIACGGEGETAPNMGGYCVQCDSHFPFSEFRAEKKRERKARLARPLWYQDQLDAMAKSTPA